MTVLTVACYGLSHLTQCSFDVRSAHAQRQILTMLAIPAIALVLAHALVLSVSADQIPLLPLPDDAVTLPLVAPPHRAMGGRALRHGASRGIAGLGMKGPGGAPGALLPIMPCL